MSMRYPGGLIAPTPVNQQYPSGVWTGAQTTPYQTNNVWANDSSFKNTTMLLHGDGATTPFIKDASTNNFQLTIAGDTKPNNLTPFITNGYWSNYFGTTTSNLKFASSASFAIGTGNFTIQCSVNFTAWASTNQRICIQGVSGTTNIQIARDSGANTLFVDIQGSTVITYSWTPNVGQWYDVAVVRSGTSTNQVALYIDGVSVATGTSSASIAQNQFIVGGLDWASGYSMQGYISNFRYSNTARTIAVPTSPYTSDANTIILTCQSNRFVDNSTNAFAITVNGSPTVTMQQPFTAPSGTSLYGSGYFDGTGDYLTAPANSTQFSPSTNNLTVEGWFYFTNLSAGVTNLFGSNNGSGATQKMTAYIETNGTIHFDLTQAGGASQATSASGAVVNNTWYHLAFVRNSSTATIYVNGTSVASGSATGNLSALTNPFYIGYIGEAYGVVMSGYISNFRYVNGTAVYTTTFTPSTTPLTAVTNTSLLTLQTNGPANNNGFLDSSLNSFPITRNGNTTQGSFTPYEANGYWSNFLGGAGNYFTTPASSASTIVGTMNGSTNLTIECWIYPTAYSSQNFPAVIGDMNPTAEEDNWSFRLNNSGVLMMYWFDGSLNRRSTSATVPLNTWTHIAVNIAAGAIGLFINGVSQASTGPASLTTVSGSRGNLTFGQWNNASGGANSGLFAGYISNFRIIKASTYTASFTPSTTPLTAIANTSLLICQSNRFIDNSTNAFAITTTGSPSVQAFQPFVPTVQYTPSTLGGSGYFDGTGDSLSIPNVPASGTGSFCFEAWIYPTNSSVNQMIIGAVNGGMWVGMNIDTANNFSIGRAFTANDNGVSFTWANNRWYHVAVNRNGTSLQFFVNGVQVGSTLTNSINYSVAGRLIGAEGTTPATFYSGYIAGLRVVNASVYTSAFTPPTAPPSVIASTTLLTNFANAAIFDNSGMNNLETVGNAQVNTGVVKYGTSSMYFDGSGDYLVPTSAGSNVTSALGSGDFTVEFWVYFIGGLGADIVLYDGRPLSTNGVYPTIYVNSSSQLSYVVSSSDRITSGSAFITNTWYHIALARTGTNTKMFVNGTQVGSTYSDSNNYLSAARRPVIAINGFNETAAPLNGYMDDLRITKGVARYVTNFTPPVARMPNQ